MIRLNRFVRSMKNEKVHQHIQLFALYLLPWALFFSEAVSAILVVVFSAPLLIFWRRLADNILLRRLWPFFAFFGLILISGFWSANTERWLSLLRVNLPYLMMPLAFSLWPKVLWRHSVPIITQFFWAGGVLSLYILYLVISPGTDIAGEIASGGYLPVPVHHVRTSLFMVVGLLAGWNQLSVQNNRRRRMIYGVVMLVLLTGLHLLAVRTGLILGYAGTVMFFLLHEKYRSRWGWMWLGGMLVVLIIVFIFSPTLSEKWNYWIEDWRNMDSHSWWFYSDAMRWKSNEMGWYVAMQDIWWGVGMGDVRDEMTLQFLQRENLYSEHYPHNLWITVMAGTGIAGLMVSNIALAVLGIRQWRSGPLWFVLFLMFMASCLVETTLFSSLGAIGFVLIFLLSPFQAKEK